jgi:glycosyltransferase involved in cell wall biosynthesis
VGGLPEVVANERSGLLVPVGDVDSLAHAIGKLVADPVLRKTMGLEGAKIVGEKFSIEKERDQWLNFYKAL